LQLSSVAAVATVLWRVNVAEQVPQTPQAHVALYMHLADLGHFDALFSQLFRLSASVLPPAVKKKIKKKIIAAFATLCIRPATCC
jgi:hypothetical protein